MKTINKLAGIVLILLSILVSIPMTIKTLQHDGGPWAFGVVGLSILIPLSTYLSFGIAGMINKEAKQWTAFIVSHLITVSTGIVSLISFPVYPKIIVVIPIVLAILGIVNKKTFRFYLFSMLLLAIAANIALLNWEFDFGRSFPLFQLFEPGR